MSPVQPEGFLAVPASGQGAAVLVLHPWWGLNETIRQVCTRLADAGFIAFAPDLYHGEVTDQISEAERLSSTLFSEHQERVVTDIGNAAAFLNERAGQPDGKIAVIGFSLGAFFALDLSVRAPEIRSVVVFYGTRPGDYTASNAEYLGHFAENDEFEPQSEVENLEAALKQAGRQATFYTYPGTGHWFFEPDRTDAYNAEAANLAWERTLAFLRRPNES